MHFVYQPLKGDTQLTQLLEMLGIDKQSDLSVATLDARNS